MRKVLFLLTAFMVVNAQAQQKLQSPSEFLGYELGSKFTRHHRVVEYYKHVAEVLPNVEVFQYGETYEGRPLIYAIATSPENFKNIEQIRLDNLRRAGLAEGKPATRVPIIWLSYNVHGNEANSTEASMLTLYELVNPANAKTQSWLNQSVVVLDPCINPDGRDRYANFVNQYGNAEPNSNPDAKEHREPWPRGRSNHYLFDLNRDWAWESQIESKHRLKLYNQWLPQVHVDFHEQGYNNPYYFAPAAEPYHEVITNWQREFQTIIGKNNAKYFDEKGWLYFTKERFDLFYPSYGDSYPVFNGGIGMTYEQGGQVGVTITTEFGDPLTLKDRLTHHHTSGLSTVEMGVVHANKLLDEFEKYFRDNINNGYGTYKTYVIKGDNQRDKLDRLMKWMDTHQIRYGHVASARPAKGFDYQTQTVSNFNLATNDIVISTHQPKGRFVTTLFEPQGKLSDSVTYDITAWNLMYAYDLKAFAVAEKIVPSKNVEAKTVTAATNSAAYAYVASYESMTDAQFLAALLRKNVRVRYASQAFSVQGKSFNAGSLIITRRNNEHLASFDQLVTELAKAHGRTLHAATTGLVDSGKDFGSSEVNYIRAPKVAVLFGDQTFSLSAGEVWHFLEQELHYPGTLIGTDYFANVDLSKYDVLIAPEGSYSFNEKVMSKISSWISSGGKLILIGNAIEPFAGEKSFAGIRRYANEDEERSAEKRMEAERELEGPIRYADAERKQISSYVSGAIYKINMDNSHPLGFGMNNHYFSLKTGELRYALLKDGWNVGYIKGNAKPVQGFAGYKVNKEFSNSVLFGVEPIGRGEIVYLVDNPLFRSFWENGKLLFSNALFMAGN